MAKSEWTPVTPQPLFRTSPYGFVVDHSTYWGIPIHGDNVVPPPADANFADISNPPSSVEIGPPHVAVGGTWTGGDFSILGTCTPPLFHSFHHKTDGARTRCLFQHVPNRRGHRGYRDPRGSCTDTSASNRGACGTHAGRRKPGSVLGHRIARK